MDDIERYGFLAHAKTAAFQRKVDQALSTIREAIAIAPCYVAVSWGKDSLVLSHLVWSVSPNTLLFHHGSDDQDEQDNYSEVQKSFLSRFPMPYKYFNGEIGGQIPKEMRPSEPMSLLGLRAEENRDRKISLKRYGLIHQYQSSSPMHPSGTWRCCPLAWWKWEDIWAYIVLHDLSYLRAYDWLPKNTGRTCVIQNKKISLKHSGLGSGQSEQLRRRNLEFWQQLNLH